MGNKKERSKEILHLIEKFNKEFGESYDYNKSVSCVHGVPLKSLKVGKGFVNSYFVETTDDTGKFTFAIIKPNSVINYDSENIIKDIEESGLKVFAANHKFFTRKEAEDFYEEHKGKFFCDELVDFMTSGPIITLVLSGDDAIKKLRDLMGPVEAINDKVGHAGTLRAKYAKNMTENSIHGSDSVESFKREVKFF